MESKNNLLSYNHFRAGFAWLILILGIGCYAFGFFVISQSSIWKEVLLKIGDVLVIGVILGYLSNAAQFLGLFKQDLQDIIYGEKFLKQRKDIYPLWESVSKEMFKNKFPTIHKEFLKTINSYFPNNEVSYYDDYETDITIEWIDKESGTVRVTHEVSFELVSDSDGKFEYPLKNWTRVVDGKSNIKDALTDITVNGVASEIKENGDSEEPEHNICNNKTIELKGATRYAVKYTRVKEYSLFDDFYIGFRAQYIVNKYIVRLTCPPDIEAVFVCRGTPHDYENVKHANGTIEKRYKGIILPRQGYIFVLRIK